MVDSGLDAIEVWYLYADEEEAPIADQRNEEADELIDRFGPDRAGGSDWYGPIAGKFRIGSLRMPLDALAAVRELARRYCIPMD